MIRHIASVSVGGLLPPIAGALAAINAKLTSELAARMRLAGMLTITPPKVTAFATAAAAIAAGMAVKGPTVRFNGTAQLSAIAALQAQLALFAKLVASLGVAGLEVYEYDGTAARFGSEVAQQTATGLPGGSSTDHINALVIATRIPAAWQALAEVLLTS